MQEFEGVKDNYHRLCLLCRKYIVKNRWNKHLIKCEKWYKKAHGLGNYPKKKRVRK